MGQKILRFKGAAFSGDAAPGFGGTRGSNRGGMRSGSREVAATLGVSLSVVDWRRCPRNPPNSSADFLGNSVAVRHSRAVPQSGDLGSVSGQGWKAFAGAHRQSDSHRRLIRILDDLSLVSRSVPLAADEVFDASPHSRATAATTSGRCRRHRVLVAGECVAAPICRNSSARTSTAPAPRYGLNACAQFITTIIGAVDSVATGDVRRGIRNRCPSDETAYA
jgi:hypothetical protein